MGLFNFLKSAPALAAQADDVFNALSEAVNNSPDPAARNRLWKAVFALPEWHFVDFAPKGGKPQTPMHTTHNDRSCVLAYTSRLRANIAIKYYSESAKVLSFAALSLSRSQALERICQLPNAKPELALFNPGTGGHGFAETVPSLAAMSDFFIDELPDGALHRLAQMAAVTPDPTPTARLVRRLYALNQWHFIADSGHKDVPQIISVDGVPHFAAHTSAAHVAERVALTAELASRQKFALAPSHAIALLRSCRRQVKDRINHVAFNPGPAEFCLPLTALGGA